MGSDCSCPPPPRPPRGTLETHTPSLDDLATPPSLLPVHCAEQSGGQSQTERRSKFITLTHQTSLKETFCYPSCLSSHVFWTSSTFSEKSLDAPAGKVQEEGHTGCCLLPSSFCDRQNHTGTLTCNVRSWFSINKHVKTVVIASHAKL